MTGLRPLAHGFRGPWLCLLLLATLLWPVEVMAGTSDPGYVRDGTFLLRSRRDQSMVQLRARMAHDPLFSRQVARRARVTASFGPADVGVQEVDFFCFNFGTSQYELRKAVLKAIGTSCYVFVVRDSETFLGGAAAEAINQIRTTFDEKIFPTNSSWFGQVTIPPAFALPDHKIYILLLDIRDALSGGYVAGYFDSADLQPEPTYEGNRMPVFFMDVNPGHPGTPTDKNNDFYRTLAHEFQHMVNFSKHLSPRVQEDRWIEEGLSGFAEYLYTASLGGNGLPPSPHLSRFLEKPDIVLSDNSEAAWFTESTLFRQYGASFLFIYYLVEKYGGATDAERQAFTRSLIDNASVSINGLNSILSGKNTNFIVVLKNWLIANHFNLLGVNGGLWGYLDKATRLGNEASLIPLAGNAHSYSAAELSFFGGQGIIHSNSGKYEDITGNGTLTLNFRAMDQAMTPFLAGVDEAGNARLRDILLDSSGAGSVQLDLAEYSKLVLVPAVATTQADVSPSFSYTFSAAPQKMRIFAIPNPAFANEFIIVVKSETRLDDSPVAGVRFNNIQSAPVMAPTDDTRQLFVGNYTIPGTGEGQVTVTLGEFSSTFTFFASVLKSGIVSRLQLKDIEFSLSSRADGDRAFLFESTQIDVPAELRMLSKPYEVMFNGPQAIEARVLFETTAQTHTPEQIGLWNPQNPDSPWIRVSRNERGWISPISRDGGYVLVADVTSPQIHDLRIDHLREQPTLVGRLTDAGSGLRADSVRVEVDGQAVPFSFDATTGVVSADLSLLARGEHRCSVEVVDRAENRVRALLAQALAGPLTIAQATAYPNPSRGAAHIAILLEGVGSDDPDLDAEARLYDVSGQRLITLPLAYKGNRTFTARWDHRNERGEKVSNGLYFFKAVIRRGGDEWKTQGKLAVLN